MLIKLTDNMGDPVLVNTDDITSVRPIHGAMSNGWASSSINLKSTKWELRVRETLAEIEDKLTAKNPYSGHGDELHFITGS